MKKVLYTTTTLAALLLVSCESATMSEAQEMVKTQAAPHANSGQRDIGNRGEVMMSIQHLDRSEVDKEDDKIRKTAAVLQFTKVWPGETVVEMEAGNGYYTEILSRIVGEKGSVLMQNPQMFDAFIKPEIFAARLGQNGERLANVTHSRTNFDVLEAADNSVDLVTWFLGPHEIWMKDKDGHLTLGDPDTVYGEIFRVLKPGGRFVALDHKAAVGAPVTTGDTTHRIDPAHIQALAEKSGLVLKEISPLLNNSADDYDLLVFDPKVRRKTDRFLHFYVKPK